MASGNNQNKIQIASINKEQHNYKQMHGSSGPHNLSSSCECDSNVCMVLSAERHDHVVEIWDVDHDCICSTLPMPQEEEPKTKTTIFSLIMFYKQKNGAPCLASGGVDKAMNMWNLSTLQKVASSHNHKSFTFAMASHNHNNNAHVASSGEDGVIKLWNVDDCNSNEH